MRSLLRNAFLTVVVFLLSVAAVYPQTNRYRDLKYGVSVSLPPGWTWRGPQRWGDQESTTAFAESSSHQAIQLYVKIFASPEELSPEQMERKLLRGVDEKLRQRREAGLTDYNLRDNSCQRRSIGGHSAISWVSEFTQHGRKMVEYLTRVRSERTNALFFAVLPPERLDDFKKRVDPIIETLQIP